MVAASSQGGSPSKRLVVKHRALVVLIERRHGHGQVLVRPGNALHQHWSC